VSCVLCILQYKVLRLKNIYENERFTHMYTIFYTNGVPILGLCNSSLRIKKKNKNNRTFDVKHRLTVVVRDMNAYS